MITVTKQYRTETAHRLRDYDGLCRHLHGHSYLWEVTAESKTGLDDRGIAVDFKDLKKAIVGALEPLDHALCLREDDPLLKEGALDEKERVHVFTVNPTAEFLAGRAAYEIQRRVPEWVRIVEVKVWETANSFAIWREDA